MMDKSGLYSLQAGGGALYQGWGGRGDLPMFAVFFSSGHCARTFGLALCPLDVGQKDKISFGVAVGIFEMIGSSYSNLILW
jgi:hypothetical protein